MVESPDNEQPRDDKGSEKRIRNPAGPQQPAASSRTSSGPLSAFAGDAAMWRFAGAGMELAGSAMLGAAVGYALDRYWENTTMIATALGAVLGFAGGLYRFIRMALAANRSSSGRR